MRNDTIDEMLPDKPQPSEAFSKWWADFGHLSVNEQPEAVASAAWDAAIKIAWVALNDEKEELLKQKRYEAAAAIRDCRERMQAYFASPGGSGPERHRFEEAVERQKQLFRRLSPEQLEKVRSMTTSPPDSAHAVALDRILRERGGNNSLT
jgi:hypothetical protein